jgi:hypothetical protein
MAKSAALETLRSRVRRGQLIVGLGFGSLLVGSVLTVALAQRLGPRLVGAPSWVLLPLELVIRNLWCLALLPLFSWAVARAVALSPWKSAVGAVLTGELFLRALLYVQGGTDAVWTGVGDLLRWLLVAGLSVVLVRTAIGRARGQAALAQARAQEHARARADEYQAFARDAQRQADRLAAREEGPRDEDVPRASGE